VPLFRNGDIYGVLDIDSDQPAAFDETDAKYLAEIAAVVAER
jgi:GAF domain-containing protein